MKKKHTSKPLDESSKRLVDMTDDDIDTTDIPKISPEQFAQAVVREGLQERQSKAQLTLRLDRDVLEWFRLQGRGYQTKINSLLRAYMVAHRTGKADRTTHRSDSPTESQVPDNP